jgi:hypothetical protein
MNLSLAELDDYLAAELATSVVTMSVHDPQGSPLRRRPDKTQWLWFNVYSTKNVSTAPGAYIDMVRRKRQTSTGWYVGNGGPLYCIWLVYLAQSTAYTDSLMSPVVGTKPVLCVLCVLCSCASQVGQSLSFALRTLVESPGVSHHRIHSHISALTL